MHLSLSHGPKPQVGTYALPIGAFGVFKNMVFVPQFDALEAGDILFSYPSVPSTLDISEGMYESVAERMASWHSGVPTSVLWAPNVQKYIIAFM